MAATTAAIAEALPTAHRVPAVAVILLVAAAIRAAEATTNLQTLLM
jgi:hypothetical protein